MLQYLREKSLEVLMGMADLWANIGHTLIQLLRLYLWTTVMIVVCAAVLIGLYLLVKRARKEWMTL